MADAFSLTDHESEARRLYAATCDLPVDRWRVIPTDAVKPDHWYDWCDPATGKYGQCCMGYGGLWRQGPAGESPVVLEYRKGGWPDGD